MGDKEVAMDGEGIADAGLATAVDEEDNGEGNVPGGWSGEDWRRTLWNAGDPDLDEDPAACCDRGGLNDGDSTIILGIWCGALVDDEREPLDTGRVEVGWGGGYTGVVPCVDWG